MTAIEPLSSASIPSPPVQPASAPSPSAPPTLVLREIALDLLSLLWPCSCAVCGAPDRELCTPCRSALRQAEGEWSSIVTPAGVAACIAGPYTGPLRALLVGYKHVGRTAYAQPLGARLRAPLSAALGHARSAEALLVTVPSRPARVRERGYRHVDLLVRRALRGMGSQGGAKARVMRRALVPLPGRTGQVGLDSNGRRRNASLIGVARPARRRLRGREVILVDDIVTTGATIAAAVRALEGAGARVIAVAALCATERRHRPGGGSCE